MPYKTVFTSFKKNRAKIEVEQASLYVHHEDRKEFHSVLSLACKNNLSAQPTIRAHVTRCYERRDIVWHDSTKTQTFIWANFVTLGMTLSRKGFAAIAPQGLIVNSTCYMYVQANGACSRAIPSIKTPFCICQNGALLGAAPTEELWFLLFHRHFLVQRNPERV